MTDLIYQLDNKLEFANLQSGEPDASMEVFLKAPSYDAQKQYFKVYQHFSAAMMHMAQNRPEGQERPVRRAKAQDEEMDGDTAMMIISSGRADLARVVEDFSELALSVGYLNEKTPLLDKHLVAVGPDELLRMCGEYLAFFVAPSLLSKTKKRGSKH